MNENYNRDMLKYALGILIILAFLTILGIYVFFLGRLGGNQYGAGVLLSNPSSDDVNARLANVQREIDDTLARMQAMQASTAQRPTATNSTQTVSAPQKFLKISNFSVNQNSIPSGSQVTFSYSSVNTGNGVNYRLLLQCPAGVSAMYQNGTNVCRNGIGQALPIENTGNYTVTLSNNSPDPQTIIAVLLASDITDNNIFFRDSKVLTVSVLPSGNYNPVTDTSAPIVLSVSPNGGTAPATIGFTATLNNLTNCAQSNWNFGDGMSSENFAVCPNSVSSIRSRVLYESHTYNNPGTYTATFTSGGRTVSSTVYVSAATSIFNTQPLYTPQYSYISQPASVYYTVPPPVYNYGYNYNYQQPPVYPSLPDVPTTPGNLRAVSSGVNGIALGWSAPAFGNVYNYTLYRKGGDSLPLPLAVSTACGGDTVNACYITVSGSATSFNDLNVSAGSTYTYRIVASNGYGTSNPSDSLTVSLSQSNSPTIPRTFTASPNRGVVVLNWSSPMSGNVANYTIYRRGGATLNTPVLTSPAACSTGTLDTCYYFVSGQTMTLTDSNLFPNTTYTYRIIASNPFGASEYSDALTVNSGQPLPPVSTPNMNSANRNDSLSSTLLSWNSVGASYYKVYRATSRNSVVPTDESVVSSCTQGTTNGCFVSAGYNDNQIFSLQVVDNQYDNTKTYYYKVRAYSGNGASDWSNETSAAPNSIITPPAELSIVTFASVPVLPHVIPEGSAWVICQTTNSIPQARLRAYTTDVSGRDRRSCSASWTDSSGGTYRYRFGCYGPTDRSTVDGSLLMGSPRNFTCEEVNTSGSSLVPPNSRSVVKTCASGDVTTPGQETACNGSGSVVVSTDPLITNFTVDGQMSPTVAAGSSVNLAYSGTNVSTYKLFLQCPAGVTIPDPSTGSNLCRTNSADAFPISSTGSYRITLNNQTTLTQQVTATLQAYRVNGTLGHTLSRVISINGQTIVTPPSTRATPIDPTRMTVNAGQTTISLSWPRSDTITTSYDVYRTTNPNAAWNQSTYESVSIGSGYSGNINDSGLTPNTTYYYYIFSVAGVSGPNNSSPVRISVATQANSQIPQGSITLSANTQTISAGGSVTFTATVNNLPTCPYPYWSWGDGSVSGVSGGCGNTSGQVISSTQISQSHTFSTAGSYYVTVSVGNVVSNQIVVNVSQVASSPDPVITSFLAAGQTAPTVSSSAPFNLTFSGNNVASYKLLLQCPANVAIPDAVGNNLCRTGESDAIPAPTGGTVQITIFNMNAGNQIVNATLFALRANGTSANSITRSITVRPQPGF